MCTGIVFRQATVEDLDQLVAARVAFITAVRASKPIEELVPDVDQFISLQREYLTEHLGTDQFIAFVAEDAGTIVGTVYAPIFQSLPRPNNPDGRWAKVVSVYTDPAYQGQGIATQLMEMLLTEVGQRGVGRVELEYTDIAFKVYERLGFEEATRYMELNL